MALLRRSRDAANRVRPASDNDRLARQTRLVVRYNILGGRYGIMGDGGQPNGVATLNQWRLSTTPGVNTLTATVVGAGVSVQVTATGQ